MKKNKTLFKNIFTKIKEINMDIISSKSLESNWEDGSYE